MFGKQRRKKNIIYTTEGIFDSAEELKYYNMLVDLVDEGYIKDIKRQHPRFDIPLSSSTSKKKTGYYKPDFYIIDWKDRVHIIDIKGDPKCGSLYKIAYVEEKYNVEIKVIKCNERKENKHWKYKKYDVSFIVEE
jgi:hypothetical protein